MRPKGQRMRKAVARIICSSLSEVSPHTSCRTAWISQRKCGMALGPQKGKEKMKEVWPRPTIAPQPHADPARHRHIR